MAKKSLARILAEIKLTNSKIEDSIHKCPYVWAAQGNGGTTKFVGPYQTEDNFIREVKAQYQSIQDLMTYRARLKSALVYANATTEVRVLGKTYTIAELIDAKLLNTTKRDLLQVLRRSSSDIKVGVQKKNEEVTKRLDSLVTSALGKDVKTGTTDYSNIAVPFLQGNEWRVVDPLGIDKLIDTLSSELDKFDAEVDLTLSEVNAKTEVGLELGPNSSPMFDITHVRINGEPVHIPSRE